ncbi:sporulation initiation factor Spo0A C-terminal domain-containing protein [Flintibacter sp. HCN-6482]|uniref:sporulation initiation factor Spo0A C-terminal domain-containing protein n=1 Tax=Eubacteriales TaxID=186802 RepID=UPI001D878970|nr:sporulation initiation factor Spo0A C-terminal domain-containing protein [Clostridiales bacterium]
MKIYFLVPEDELPQDQFDRKALDIEALLRRLGVTRKLTGFQYVCYMVNQVVEDPSRLSLITKRLYPETARHFHTTRDSIELATRNVIRAVWGQADHRLLDHIAGIHLEKRPSNCEFIDILSSFLSRPQEDKEISSEGK